jgi:hypothetical protein
MYSLESIGVSRKEAEDILGVAKDFVAALGKLL